MADKETEEILASIRKATSQASGGKGQSSTGGAFKKIFKSLIYDDGESEDGSTTPILLNSQTALENAGYPPVPEVSIPETGDAGNRPFTDIYTEAGVTSDMSVDELETMLNSDELKTQPISLKQVAINFALKQKGITINVPIADASARDAALDGYAMTLLKRAKDGRATNDAKIAGIEQDLQDYFAAKQAEIDSLKSESLSHENDYQTFIQRKAVEEQRIVDAIKPFLNGAAIPVTVGNEPLLEADVATAKK